MNIVRVIVSLMYLFGMCFIASAAILQSGLGLASYSDCYSAIIICLIFYVGSKVFMYLFLVCPTDFPHNQVKRSNVTYR